MQNPATGYLHRLCNRGTIREIREYLGELSNTQTLEESVGFLGYTPLHEATSQGHVSAVRLLLLYGADPNATANGFYTPLHMAASMDNVLCVEELLKQDANISCRDEFGKTPYETAVIHRCKKTAKLLKSEEIKKLAAENSPQLKETLRSIRSQDLSPSCLQEALQGASRMGHVDAINSIILAGVTESRNFNDCIGLTLKFHFVQAASVLLVCHSAQHGQTELLKYLMGVTLVQEGKDVALSQLPFRTQVHPLINNIRAYLKNKEEFQVAVPLQLALHNTHRDAVRVLLLCTNCKREAKEIDWRNLGLKDLMSSLLKEIRWAEKLFLPSNLLTSIPSNIIDLHRLCRLDLRKNHLQKIPSGLLKMNCLRNLDLSENKLVELPRKGHWSPSLKTLYLSDNLLETLPNNMASAKLKNLYLARNNLYEVPACVCELLTLETLDLSGNHRLTQLPVQMGKLTKISSLRLDNLEQVTDPPEEIKKNGFKTIMYLRAKLRSSKGYYCMKLMLVGRAAQGKTTLMHRLMLDNSYADNSATNGISMEEFRLRKDLFHREFVFKIWDFGGQEDYYATHQCFLSTLSLYILVWSLEDGEEGAHRLEGWLDTISARAPGTSLVIVGTHLDKIRKDKEKYDVEYVSHMHKYVEGLCGLPKYRRINIKAIKEVSCAVESREGIDDLRYSIYDVAATLLKGDGPNQVHIMGEPIPHSYFLVEELINNRKEELKNDNKLPFIHRAEFDAIVSDTIRGDSADVEDPDDLKEVTRFLHERGVLMHYDDPNQDLQDYYFIDPAWLCDLMARIVTLREANPHIIDGILSKDKFEFIFKGDRFPYQNYDQFVRLLNRFQIACSLDENRLLVPSKLPEEKPQEATSCSLPYITVKRIHSLPFMPYGFWDRFIARFLYYTKDMMTSGCARDPSPGSPGTPLRSPFDLDPFFCKCPLTGDSVLSGETPHTSTSSIPMASSKNDTSEGGKEKDENQSKVLAEDCESYARYIDEDNEASRGGVYINGIWFGETSTSGRGTPESEAEFGYSTDDEETDEGFGYGRPYTPRVIRQSGVTYRVPDWKFTSGYTSSKKREKESSKNNNDVCSQSYSSGDFRDIKSGHKFGKGGRSASADPPKSLPRSFLGGHYQSTSRSEQGIPCRDSPLTSSNAPNLSFDESSTDGTWDGRETGSLSSRSSEGGQKGVRSSSVSSQASSAPSLDMGSEQRKVDHQNGSTSESVSTVDLSNQEGDDSSKSSSNVSSSVYCSTSDVESLSTGEVISERLNATSTAELVSNSCRVSKEDSSNISISNLEIKNGKENERQVKDPEEFDQKEASFNPPLSHVDVTENATGVINGYVTLKEADVLAGTSFVHRKKHSNGSDNSSPVFKEPPNDMPSSTGHPSLERDMLSSDGDVFSSYPDVGTKAYDALPPKQLDFKEYEDNSAIGERGKGDQDLPKDTGLERDTTNQQGRGNPYQMVKLLETQVHETTCPCRDDFTSKAFSDPPADLSRLVDERFLRCWRSGVCLHHRKLFFMVSNMPDPVEDGRQLIVTEVSPNRVGRRVLSYIVDHIDTLIREWYPDLFVTDGREPKVKQSIPCVVCERLGITPSNVFSFVQCQSQSASTDTIPCPNHRDLDLNLHLVAPDIMLHDVDPDLLLSQEEIVYDDSESSLLGSGGFGKVMRGECRGQSVAIKFFDKSDETDPVRHYLEARKELNVLRRVRQHPYLISIIGVSLRPLCLVLELAEKGSLQESLFSSMVIHRIVLFRIAYQIADALSYLHTLGIIYRDLKPENILVWSLDERDDLHVKLIDFGTANFATSAGLISCKGSLGNNAPEMLDVEKKEEYTEQVDVYSYAVLLFQLITRKPPFMEIDSEPQVNEAVVKGERPKWQGTVTASYGLPALTELMLQCWISKPTKRPKSDQVAEQVRMPAFQALLGKTPIPAQQSVRHACVALEVKEVWMACCDHSGNKVLVFDCQTLDLKHSFSVESYQEKSYPYQVQCLHLVGDLMLIAFRGAENFINAYSTTSRYKLAWCLPFGEQITSISSDEKYVYVGMNEGYVRCVMKKDFKKPEKKRNDINIKVERHRILSVVAVDDKLWISSSKYIFTYFTKTVEMEAFDMESMWYGGTIGFEDNPQTQINNLTISFDHLGVWSTCRSVLTKWCLETRQRKFEIDCSAIVKALSDSASSVHDSDTYIVCLGPTLDTVWVGTGSGHILIFSAEEPRLYTWFHPFQEVRTLSMCLGPGPCGTEQCFIISTGKGLRPEGLGTSNPVVCPLTADRVRDVPDEFAKRKQEEEARRKSHKRSTSGSKLKSASSLEKQEVDGGPMMPIFKCYMMVWEAPPASVLQRMEQKSGRDMNRVFQAKRETEVFHNGDSPSL